MKLLQMLKHCLNPRVLVGVIVVAVGLVLLAPKLALLGLPLLFALICPLSMGLMMWGMGRMGVQTPPGSPSPTLSADHPGGAMPHCPPQPAREAELAQLRSQQVAIQEQIRVLEGAEAKPPALLEGGRV